MKIYTKVGDGGETSLLNGQRVSKSHVRLMVYGGIDELNSHIGLLKNLATDHSQHQLLVAIQNNLFNAGSLFASDRETWQKYKLKPIDPLLISVLEQAIDQMNLELPELKNFILPDGSKESCQAHICRCVCRRVEREMATFKLEFPDEMPDNSLEFFNRLSDYFFVLARFYNFRLNIAETKWC